MAEFKKGDTVRLMSGGPLMTIVDFGTFGIASPEDGVKCTWFDGPRRVEDVFDRATLKPSAERVSSGRIERA